MFRSRRARLTVGLTAVLLGLAAPTASAKTVTQTATHGPLSASFSFSFRQIGTFQYGHLSLTISAGGNVQYHRPVTSSFCQKYCEPGDPGKNGASMAFKPLSSSGTQLVLDLYSGGAHCCSIVQVFSQANSTSGWSRSSFNFGDPGYRLVDLSHDGTDEFLSANDSFAYAFTDYAASGMPLMILRWQNGHFADVTRDHPLLIAHDAALWMRAFKQEKRSHYTDTTGVIAAWAADEDELGHAGAVATFLRRAAAAKELNSGVGTPENARFVMTLNRFLRKQGYLK